MSTDDAEFDADAWVRELEEHREQKDEFFADHPQSPLPEADKPDFEGLTYYDPDPSFRVPARVEPVDGTDTIELEMTQGEPREYERVARLAFELGGEERALYAYRQAEAQGGDGTDAGPTTLFVPFRDGTTGDTTCSEAPPVSRRPPRRARCRRRARPRWPMPGAVPARSTRRRPARSSRRSAPAPAGPSGTGTR